MAILATQLLGHLDDRVDVLGPAVDGHPHVPREVGLTNDDKTKGRWV